MEKNTWIAALVAALIVGGFGGYFMGQRTGYQKGDVEGFKRAEADIKKGEELAGKKAIEDAAKAANPFQTANPLQGVESNPFEKAKKILNPFQ